MAVDLYTTVLTGSVAGQMVQNVMHFQSDVDNAPNPGGDAIRLNNGFDPAILTSYLACMADNYTLSTIRSRRRNNGGGNSATYIPGSNVGTFGDDASDALTGGQIHWPFTDGAGHYGTGRTFMPGASDDAINDGKLTTAYLTALDAFITDVLAGFTNDGVNFEFRIWSPTLNGHFGPQGGGVAIKPGFISKRLKPVF